MKNKERDVIGREGSTITVRVKRSNTSEFVGRDSVREKGNAVLNAQVTEFKSEYGY